jgi:hypothetical protein
MTDTLIRNTPANGDPRTLYWGGLAVAVGALGVVVTSVLYALSPPQAVLPMPNPALADALREMIAGQTFIVAAGTIGILADIILAAGAFTLMLYPWTTGLHFKQLGWACLAISTLIFTLVDGLSAGVLTQLAALDGAYVGWVGFKRLFDVLFISGTIAFGFGGLAVLASDVTAKLPMLPKPLTWIGMGISAAGLGASLLYFANVNLAPVIGLSIAGGTLIFTVYGIQAARWSRR